jgi:hypothetical protein
MHSKSESFEAFLSFFRIAKQRLANLDYLGHKRIRPEPRLQVISLLHA